ncbi:hypothetical protein CIPAW_08G179500 [Carya illinoinensis]|uniref:Uncharacterized protein n=1 Tax=Carya illinoinensis TaxID=32201 RepID=A0A8T1PZS3_CARIL|nr:hypothetical protein CIPAW_08G179500 [Carya illinoinensis]
MDTLGKHRNNIFHARHCQNQSSARHLGKKKKNPSLAQKSCFYSIILVNPRKIFKNSHLTKVYIDTYLIYLRFFHPYTLILTRNKSWADFNVIRKIHGFDMMLGNYRWSIQRKRI